jgi:subfamily B ATP-binding cassette protein MsbA
MTQFYHTPIWKIFAGPRYSNWRYLLLIFIPHVLAALFEGGSFGFIFMAFSAIQNGGEAHSSSLLDLSRWGLQLSPMHQFYVYLLIAIAMQAFRSLVNFLALYGTSLFSLNVQTSAQKQVYSQIFRFSFPFVSQYKIGDLSEYVKIPSSIIPTFFEAVNRFSVSVFVSFGLLAVLCWLSPLLTGLTLILFIVFAGLQKFLIQKVLKFSSELTTHLFEFSHETVQSLQGIRPIHIFHKQHYIFEKIKTILDRVASTSKKVHLWNNIIPTINETVNVLLVGAILILGSLLLVQSKGGALPNLLTYMALTYRFANRMQIAMSALGSIGIHYGSLLRLNDILSSENKEYDPCDGKEFKKWTKVIEFKDVTLVYPQSAKPALKEISFSIAKGTTVAIVGLSGAGKSSILDLILGLQKPSSGQILIDSTPLSSFSHESWRKKIGVVSQDTFIFNGTIEENIRFGDLNCSEQKMKTVAKLAGASDFIEALPRKYETVVGERGHKLSGGERQRIALARALIKDPEILVLDEATSNLDSCSERLIQGSLDLMGKNKTLILVAHRLSTVIKADQILVLEEGKIIEKGHHETLLLQKGRYAQLWKLQSEKTNEIDEFATI